MANQMLASTQSWWTRKSIFAVYLAMKDKTVAIMTPAWDLCCIWYKYCTPYVESIWEVETEKVGRVVSFKRSIRRHVAYLYCYMGCWSWPGRVSLGDLWCRQHLTFCHRCCRWLCLHALSCGSVDGLWLRRQRYRPTTESQWILVCSLNKCVCVHIYIYSFINRLLARRKMLIN